MDKLQQQYLFIPAKVKEVPPRPAPRVVVVAAAVVVVVVVVVAVAVAVAAAAAAATAARCSAALGGPAQTYLVYLLKEACADKSTIVFTASCKSCQVGRDSYRTAVPHHYCNH